MVASCKKWTCAISATSSLFSSPLPATTSPSSIVSVTGINATSTPCSTSAISSAKVSSSLYSASALPSSSKVTVLPSSASCKKWTCAQAATSVPFSSSPAASTLASAVSSATISTKYINGTSTVTIVYTVPVVPSKSLLTGVYPTSDAPYPTSGKPSGPIASATVPGSESCSTSPTTSTITMTEYATAYPTNNAHGHGGPYYNPYNDASLPYTFPGMPTSGQSIPGPLPSTPYSYGGPASARYEPPCWIPKGSDKLVPSLKPGEQNGNSQWGEIDCPHLPVGGLPGGPTYATLTATSMPSGPSAPYPTGGANSTKTSASGSATGTGSSGACPTMPDTGVTRTYDLHVAYQTIAPDGVPRNGLTINGQFPGPLVSANWGDWILLKVSNDLTDEGTTIHAHGLLQKETPWYDGVPGVSTCPLVPKGGYEELLFRADQYGTSWYHSHYSAQYSGGAHGPLVIYGPKHAEYDIDLGPVQVEDWFHADYYSLVNDTMHAQFPPSNNVLINGKMQYPCANTTLPCSPNAGVSKFKFQSGKKHLLRLINAGAEGVQKFSIDGHKLTIISNDFVPIQPYTTNVVTLAIGQRSDVIVEAIGKPSDTYWMRSQLGTNHCTLNDGISPAAVAAVYYEDADTDSVPATTSDVTAAQLADCRNDPLNMTIPICQQPVEEAETTITLTYDFKSNGTNFVWFVNNQSYRADYNNPTLLQAKNGNLDFTPESNVYNFGTNKTVRIVMINNGVIGGHPMHLHGHDFQVLASGTGAWDGTVVNAANPIRRDTHLMENGVGNPATGVVNAPSYMVMQYTQDNPGVWPLHCHLAWHVSGGFFLQVLERPDDVKKQRFPKSSFDTCSAWGDWTSQNFVDQIDSGQ